MVGVSLSIKDVPEALAEQLRQRAARSHRSLQRELMAIIEATVNSGAPGTGTVVLREPEAAYAAAPASTAAAATDALLPELDAIVAGTRWGNAALLPRALLHDRRLLRELDYETRQSEAGADVPAHGMGTGTR